MEIRFNHCLRCRRPLKDVNSMRRGYGSFCYRIVNVKINNMEKIFKPTVTNYIKAEESKQKLWHKILKLEYPTNTCLCGKKIENGVLCSYDHENGIEAEGYGKPQWFYVHCDCGYDYSLQKMRIYDVEGD